MGTKYYTRRLAGVSHNATRRTCSNVSLITFQPLICKSREVASFVVSS